MKRTAENLIVDLLIKAEEHFNKPFPLPEVVWSLRGRVAGRYEYEYRTIDFKAVESSHRILLHPKLLKKYGLEYIERTVYHEVAHMVTVILFGAGTQPHGYKWQTTMDILGAKDKTARHDFDTSDIVKMKQVKCGCKIHSVTVRKWNNIKKNPTGYRCNFCGSDVQAI